MKNNKKIRTANYLYLENHFDSLEELLQLYEELEQTVTDNKETTDLAVSFDYDILTDEDGSKDYMLIFDAVHKSMFE